MCFRNSLRAVAVLLACLGAAHGAGAASHDDEAAALKYLIASAPPGVVKRLDTSDKQAVAGFRVLLQRSGFTPRTHAALYSALDKPAEPQPRPEKNALLLEILGFGTDTGATISATAAASPGSTAKLASLTTTLFDKDYNTLASASEEKPNSAQSLVVTTNPAPNPSGGEVIAVATFYGVDAAGNSFGPYYSNGTAAAYPQQVVNTAPAGTGTVQVCIDRTAGTGAPPSPCSAILASAVQPAGLLVPVAGSAKFQGPIDVGADGKPAKASATLLVLDPSAKPACDPVNLGGQFLADPNTVVDGDTISWSMNPASFGTTCPTDGRAYTFALALQVSVAGQPAWVSVNNLVTTSTTSTVAIPPLKVIAGCIAAGTSIVMEGGATKAVETLKPGDKIRSGTGSLALAAIATAPQNKTVTVTADDGSTVRLSQIHPVVTARGTVQAQDLRLDDVLTTATGTAKVTRIDQQVLADPVAVYDLVLTPATVSAKQGSTLFAGGILVGDGAMKAALSQAKETN
jgi:hypothetical protein